MIFMQAQLSMGNNKGKAMVCRVIVEASKPGDVPAYYACTDSEERCFCVSAFGIAEGAIKAGSLVTILDPELKKVSVSSAGKEKGYAFDVVRVSAGSTDKLLVENKPLSRETAGAAVKMMSFNLAV